MIVYAGKTQHWYQLLVLVAIGVVLGAVVYLVFRAADPISG